MRTQNVATRRPRRKLASFALVPTALTLLGLAACGGPPDPADYPTTNLGNGPGPAPTPPESLSGDLQLDAKKNKFDEEQAKIVLARAASNAHTCVDVVDKDQPHGDGTVTVTFSGKGKSTNAKIAPPFDGTAMGQCATRAFVNIIIPPFDGPDVDMTYAVNLKPDPKAAAPKKDGLRPEK